MSDSDTDTSFGDTPDGSAKRIPSSIRSTTPESPLFVSRSNNKRPKTDTIYEPTSCSFPQAQLSQDGRMPAYDASKEYRPVLAIYHDSFKEAEKDVQKACDLVLNAYKELRALGYTNEEIDNVCSDDRLGRTRDPSNFYPFVKPVAVLGPAGSGKSSASNSIMNQQKVAYEHDGEDRGTYTVHEYTRPRFDQTAKYDVTVPYHSMKTIREDIVNYHQDIDGYLFAQDDDGKPQDEDDQALEQRFDTGLTYFTDLLCNRKEFKNLEATRAYFDDDQKDKIQIVADLIDYVSEALAARPGREVEGNKSWEIFNAESEHELHHIFKKVSRPPKPTKKGQEPSPWPVIRKVVVAQSVPLLIAGVTLADTPGINDNNLTVVRNTELYLRKAGTILVFLSYKRIEANSPLDQLLAECITLGKMDSTHLVITMIDEMKLFSDDQKEDLEEEDRKLLEEAENGLNQLKAKIKSTTSAKQKARRSNKDLFAELDDELEKLEMQETIAVADVKQLTIQIRCRGIDKQLKGRLKKIDKSKYAPDLPIHFISNTQYQKHVASYDASDLPCLDIEASGIPALRRMLFAVPAYGKLNNLKGIAHNRLPNQLRGIRGILTTTKLERKAELRKVIISRLGQPAQPLAELQTEVTHAFKKLIMSTIESNEEEWAGTAMDLLEAWSKYNAGTFRGVCQRLGEWEGHKKHGNVNWNEELLAIFSRVRTSAFNKFNERLEGIEKEFKVNVENMLASLRIDIENLPAASGQNLDDFFLLMEGVMEQVTDDLEKKFKVLKDSITHTRHASTLNAQDCYVAAAMEKTYEGAVLNTTKAIMPFEPANTTTNTGRKRRAKKKESIHGSRVHTMKMKLSGDTMDSIFTSVGKLAEKDVKSDIKKWADECSVIISTGYNEILSDFDRRYSDANVKKEQDPQAVEKLLGAVDSAWEIVNGPLKQHLEECEAYEIGCA